MRFHGHRDMLHDTDRNEAYARAIAEAVRRIRNSSDSEPYAVDIGAGSGLLGSCPMDVSRRKWSKKAKRSA